MKAWLDTKSTCETSNRSEEVWFSPHETASDSVFWVNVIKFNKEDYQIRLDVSRQNLPLPRAFSEAAKALRGMIRIKRKSGENYDKELSELYWYSAIQSFGVSYSDKLKVPGFNVMQSVPGDIILGLKFKYDTLGYKELELASQTDIKWYIESWGDPSRHTNLNAIHGDIWEKYEDKLATRYRDEQAESDEIFTEAMAKNTDYVLKTGNNFMRSILNLFTGRK